MHLNSDTEQAGFHHFYSAQIIGYSKELSHSVSYYSIYTNLHKQSTKAKLENNINIIAQFSSVIPNTCVQFNWPKRFLSQRVSTNLHALRLLPQHWLPVIYLLNWLQKTRVDLSLQETKNSIRCTKISSRCTLSIVKFIKIIYFVLTPPSPSRSQ